MDSEILIRSGAVFNLGFAVFHLFFWKLFEWKKESKRMSRANYAIIQIFNLCLILVFIAMGWISWFHSGELLGSALGKTVIFFFGLFWAARFLEQFIFLRVNRVMVHVLSVLFLLGTLLYSVPFFRGI
ncbi:MULTISPECIES: hypothetical protein [unclassified Leptospira]|uniref:hypothetical protein n=1 Tax=unclassified Leptospira TaxID=2633828 RepID=UPI0002BF7A9F|nr:MULTISPECIES: hypothetical protein [unclassified Leptospira]EMK00533.1 hypothetical protein LEP1GSC192_2338 [Leptospira sp. B5-022]MCR1793071.1 hypothetical protein [Leptospira sp. id769339]